MRAQSASCGVGCLPVTSASTPERSASVPGSPAIPRAMPTAIAAIAATDATVGSSLDRVCGHPVGEDAQPLRGREGRVRVEQVEARVDGARIHEEGLLRGAVLRLGRRGQQEVARQRQRATAGSDLPGHRAGTGPLHGIRRMPAPLRRAAQVPVRPLPRATPPRPRRGTAEPETQGRSRASPSARTPTRRPRTHRGQRPDRPRRRGRQPRRRRGRSSPRSGATPAGRRRPVRRRRPRGRAAAAARRPGCPPRPPTPRGGG